MKIFISYRRNDCEAEATTISWGLQRVIPEAEVFFDVDSIPLGMDFERHIRRSIQESDVALVVIGDDWLAMADTVGDRRIDDPKDYVHIEISLALKECAHVVPVLVEGASMPAPSELPEPLRDLARLNAFEVRAGNLSADVDSLARRVKRLAGEGPRPSVSTPLKAIAHELDESDEIGRVALAAAQKLVERDRELTVGGQQALERDLAAALAESMPGAGVERKWLVPMWDPQPGRFDVIVAHPDGRPRVAIETKLKDSNDIYESVWDALKLTALGSLSHVEGVYIAAATTARNWQRPITGIKLFEAGTQDAITLLQGLGDWWAKYILANSAGRPQYMPTELKVDLVATISLPLRGGEWELRIVRLSAAGQWVELQDGMPPVELDSPAGERDALDPQLEEDTLLVAAGRAYLDYRRLHAYVCQPNRPYRRVKYLGFYRHRAVQPELAEIKHRREAVPFTHDEAARLNGSADPHDQAVGTIVERTLRGDTSNEAAPGSRHDVTLLSGPDDPATLRIGTVLHNGRGAWLQSRRYVDSRQLQDATTTDDVQTSREPRTASLDLQAIGHFIGSIPTGRWAAIGDVAQAGGVSRGTSRVEEALREGRDRLTGVHRVLDRRGQIDPSWTPPAPGTSATPDELAARLTEEGVIFDGRGRAHPGQRWRVGDWSAPRG